METLTLSGQIRQNHVKTTVAFRPESRHPLRAPWPYVELRKNSHGRSGEVAARWKKNLRDWLVQWVNPSATGFLFSFCARLRPWCHQHHFCPLFGRSLAFIGYAAQCRSTVSQAPFQFCHLGEAVDNFYLKESIELQFRLKINWIHVMLGCSVPITLTPSRPMPLSQSRGPGLGLQSRGFLSKTFTGPRQGTWKGWCHLAQALHRVGIQLESRLWISPCSAFRSLCVCLVTNSQSSISTVPTTQTHLWVQIAYGTENTRIAFARQCKERL